MWKRALVFSILLAGFSVPAKAQVQFIPIEVYCVKDSESFNALCAKLKQKISGTRDLTLIAKSSKHETRNSRTGRRREARAGAPARRHYR